MLEFSSYETSGVLVIALEPRDRAAPDGESQTREALYRVIEAHPGARVAIDLGAFEYLSSSEIGFLIGLKRRIEALRGRVALYQVDPYIVDTFRTMRLNQLFTIAGDFSEAVKAIESAAP